MRSLLSLGLVLALIGCSKDNGGDGNGGGNSCTTSVQCTSGRFCSLGKCSLAGSVGPGGDCWASRDCESGFYCSLAVPPDSGVCKAAGSLGPSEPCKSDADCVAGLRCEYQGFVATCRDGGTGDVGASCGSNIECLPGLFCGANGTCVASLTAFQMLSSQPLICTDEGEFRSYFEVPRPTRRPLDFFRLPYPNDARVTVAGATRTLDIADFPRPGGTPLGPDLVKLYVDALTADFDGFGAVAPISFRFSKALDFNFLLDHFGSVHTIDVTGGAEYPSRYFFYSPASKYNCANLLSVTQIAPDLPYAAKHTIMVVITRDGVKSGTGETPTQDPDLVAVLGAARPTADDSLAHAWDVYAPVRKYVTDNHLTSADIVNAAVFTVGDTTGHMQHLATAVAAQQPPTIVSLFECGGSGTDPCNDGSPERQCGAADPDFTEVHGQLRMPLFQSGTPPYLTSGDGGGLAESSGTVTKQGMQDVCFALTLPKKTMPSAGWPLLVYSHGTGGSFRSFISDGVASAMAKATPAAAVFSFDSVGHGARRGAATDKSPDVLVFNVTNPRAARDNWLQGAADILTALQLPRSQVPGTWSGPTIKFAGDPAFFGHSQGATHGSLAVAFSDDAPAVVLSGAGANLASSLVSKTSPFDIPNSIGTVIGDGITYSHPFIGLLSNYFDRADPANYDRLIIRTPPGGRSSKHVYMSWGKGDTYTPTATLNASASYLGIPFIGRSSDLLEDGDFVRPFGDPTNPNNANAILRPVHLDMDGTPGNVTAGLFQYNPPSGDGHFVATTNTQAIKDWTSFLSSFFATGSPTIAQ